MLRETTEAWLPYSPQQLFDIAADVQRYPEFLRWWIAVRVRDPQPGGYCTDQVLGLGPIRVKFESETLLDRPRRIDVRSTDTAFQELSICWLFEEQAGAGCHVRLSVALELRSRLLQAILENVMPNTADDIMSAFETRARELCGPSER